MAVTAAVGAYAARRVASGMRTSGGGRLSPLTRAPATNAQPARGSRALAKERRDFWVLGCFCRFYAHPDRDRGTRPNPTLLPIKSADVRLT
jgi:hypothetical protein